MMRKKALITGITGQDGSYLCELLLKKDYEVHGLVRRSSSLSRERLDLLSSYNDEFKSSLFLHYGDLSDIQSIENLIQLTNPDEIYNLGAQSHVGISFEIPKFTYEVNSGGVLAILESIRRLDKNVKFYQASTSELFGNSPAPQSEKSIFDPRSPYAISKLSAYWHTRHYRESYGVHATNGILFNHESPRRGQNFVTRKISIGVSEIVKGRKDKLILGNLDAIRDWGFAKEYVEGMWLMLQQDTPDDYVVATGVGARVLDFVEKCFSYVNLDWRDYVNSDLQYQRPLEVNKLIGDSTKAYEKLKWKPKVLWSELAEIMVEADLRR